MLLVMMMMMITLSWLRDKSSMTMVAQ